MNYTGLYLEDIRRIFPCIPGIEELKGASILITGATGMICSAVADTLLQYNRVCSAGIKVMLAGRSRERLAARFSVYEEEKDYFFVPYDATKEEPLAITADYMIHGASNANPVIYTKQPVETMLANIVGLNTLLRGMADSPAKRLLYISSSEVYGRKEGSEPYREDEYGFVDILNPRACYPCAKRAAETLCAAYCQEYGVESVIVRPGHIYGPTITESDTRASAQFTRNAVNHENIVMKSAGTQARSYCYTLDCASAILTVLLRGEAGSAYNISNPDSIVTIREMAECLAAAAGTEVVFEDPTLLEQKGYNLMDNSSLHSERLLALGWKPLFGMKEGAEHTVSIMKND